MIKRDLSISMAAANIYAILFVLPPTIMLGWWYVVLWGGTAFDAGMDWLFGNFLLFLAIFLIGIVVHELIHGITWALAGRIPLSQIKFGFQLQTLTPYAHCTVPLRLWPYRIGAAMPGIITGVLPALIGLSSGNGGLFMLGLFFIFAAGGDICILWTLRNVQKDALVEDHPERAGCFVLEPSAAAN